MSMKQLLFFASFFFAAFCLLIVFPLHTHAQTTTSPLNLTLSPSFFDLTANPGQTIQNKLRIRNNALTPMTLRVSAKKLISDPVTGQPIPAEPTAADTYISWIKFSPAMFTIPPQDFSTVSFTITIPKDAAFGYYYVVQLAPTATQQLHGIGTKVQGQVLAAILLTVNKPGAKSQLQLVSFKPDNFVNEYLPVTFSTQIANTGNVHLRPEGNIFIRRDMQKDLGVLDINPHLGAILPGGKRLFTASWDDGFLVNEPVIQDGQVQTDTKGKPIYHLVMNWNKLTNFRIGKFTASLLVVYDDGKHDQTLEASTDFWVVPYTAIAVIVGSLLILLLLIRFLLKLYVRSQLKKYQKR